MSESRSGALQRITLCTCGHGQWFCASVWEHQVCVPQSTSKYQQHACNWCMANDLHKLCLSISLFVLYTVPIVAVYTGGVFVWVSPGQPAALKTVLSDNYSPRV